MTLRRERAVQSPATGEWWTGAAFASPPTAGDAPGVVLHVQRWWRAQSLWGCREQAQALGWEVRTARLGAERSGLQAVLMPRLSGGFVFVLDTAPTTGQAAAGAGGPRLLEWRLAHEYAHTFFYARRLVPRRPRPACREEEVFCDAFANALLGTDLSSTPQQAVNG